MQHRRPRSRSTVAHTLLGAAALTLTLISGTVALTPVGDAVETAGTEDAGHARAIRAAADAPSARRPDSASTPAAPSNAVPVPAPPESTTTVPSPDATSATTTSAPATSSTPAATSTVPTAVPSAPVASAAAGVGPHGPSGAWTQVFGDEFTGSALDTTRWVALDGWAMNNVTNRASNVSVSGGTLVLTLSSPLDGAEVDSDPADGAGVNGFTLQVGDYVEASINFPGDGARLYNWPAWWASGAQWPTAGEHDIAEVLDGTNTVNYHSSSGAHNQGAVPGYWGGAFHTYGLERLADHANVYWDGTLVTSYATDDDGRGQALLLNVGRSGTAVTGAASQVRVDWVRAYRPAR